MQDRMIKNDLPGCIGSVFFRLQHEIRLVFSTIKDAEWLQGCWSGVRDSKYHRKAVSLFQSVIWGFLGNHDIVRVAFIESRLRNFYKARVFPKLRDFPTA